MSEVQRLRSGDRCLKHGTVLVRPQGVEPFCWPCSQDEPATQKAYFYLPRKEES